MAQPSRSRRIEVRSIPPSRRVVTAALRAGRRIAPVHGLISVDVTAARRLLKSTQTSLTAFVVASVGRAASAHPEVHAYRDWRGRLVLHRHVDVATLVEVQTPDGAFPMAHLVRDADVRTVDEISEELRRIKADTTASRSGRLLARLAPLVGRIPGAMRLAYAATARSVRLRRSTGTVAVTSVGMFADGGGFGIGHPTMMSLVVLVGGLSERPRVVEGRVEIREVLDVTVTVDHNVVDGAPAARFVADLRRLLETAEAIR